MKTTLLLEQWELTEGPADGAMPAADAEWIQTTAPSDTYVTLHRAGRIDHPFAGQRNEKDCSWVAERYWWWRARFNAVSAAPGERLLLQFEGLDTYAEVSLNGEPIGSSGNMFLPLECDIGARLREGSPNEILVRFTPPNVVAGDRTVEHWPALAGLIVPSRRTLHRKAQFGWGWDWAPNLPTVGIWRPVKLLRQRLAVIQNLRFTTLSIAPEAEVEIEVEVDAFAASGALDFEVELTAPKSDRVAARGSLRLGAGVSRAHLRLSIADPQLWWTADLGQPALYGLKAAIYADGGCLDQRELRVGLRKVELDTSPDPDDPGCNFFRFRLNGVNIFARGACWVPASSFVAELKDEDYRRLVREAAQANLNMLRIWGGGIYEHEAFYEACDERGLLVWQDFMFACAPYPEDDPVLVASIRGELAYQVRRLRNHPSIALWCGENESQLIERWTNLEAGIEKAITGALYFQKMMPEAVNELHPTATYWPGSPFGGGVPQ